ncbi:MAG: S24 family peptidase [Chloroflexi bacterium]|nr:S24 family peptidase [Chloroflexota bacterium]
MDAGAQREIIARLIEERREDFASLSRLLGKNAAYMQQFIKRGTPRRLSEEDRKTLARHFGINEQVLRGDRAVPEPRPSAGSLVPIVRFAVNASAGHGALQGEEARCPPIAFDSTWLKRLCSARPDDLSIIHVEGDSMIPTLADGDEIMVNRADATARLRDGIYVLRHEDTLLVKRLSLNPSTRKLTISSDNPAYPTWPECSPRNVDVIGRVVWSGRRIR